MTWALTNVSAYAAWWNLTPQEETWVLDVNQDTVIDNNDLYALETFIIGGGGY